MVFSYPGNVVGQEKYVLELIPHQGVFLFSVFTTPRGLGCFSIFFAKGLAAFFYKASEVFKKNFVVNHYHVPFCPFHLESPGHPRALNPFMISMTNTEFPSQDSSLVAFFCHDVFEDPLSLPESQPFV